MNKLKILCVFFIAGLQITAQNNSEEAKILLNEVSSKMGVYNNMTIDFTSTLVNEEAGITDDPPIEGHIIISGENYNLEYLGNKFIFNSKTLVVINDDEKEISILEGDLEEEDGFIYPSKLLTFYEEGYNYKMGVTRNEEGHKIQYINLTPIDSNADIVNVRLGINLNTKHIYKLIQTGSNGAVSTFTITSFKGNQPISSNLFDFDRAKYEKLDYLID